MTANRTKDRRVGAGPSSLRSYVACWAVAGAVGVTTVLVVVDPAGRTVTPTLLVLLGLTAIAEAVSVNMRSGDSGVTLSLLEAAVVVDMLLLGPSGGVMAVVGAILLQHVIRGLAPLKVIFNAGQHAAGASVAALLLALAPGPSPVGIGRAVAMLLAVTLYRVISTRALVGIFARIDADTLRDKVDHRWLELAATAIGNASLGIIAAALWSTHPTVVWIVAAPAVALFMSYGASYRIEGLFAQVRVERDRLDRIVGGINEGIVLLDPDGQVLVWNPAMARMIGRSAAETVGMSADDVLAGTDDRGLPHLPASVVRGQSDDGPVEVRVDDVHGQLVPLRLQHTLLRDDAGRCTGDVIVVHDLAREREAAALKEDFVARVSHELRTPLSPLRAYAQSLRRAGDRVPVDKRAEVLDQMVERVDHLARLVDDLLLVSQIGAGRVDPAREVALSDVDLGELVPRLVAWLGSEHVRDHTIEVVGSDTPVGVLADAMRTGQVVTNLLTNACKYSRPGTTVTIRLEHLGDRGAVVVEDHGPGIPEDKLEAIFERFERLDDPQRMQTGGIGLGLYISRHLTEAMGGTLTVASTRGVGTTFTLALPLADTTTMDPAVMAAAPA